METLSNNTEFLTDELDSLIRPEEIFESEKKIEEILESTPETKIESTEEIKAPEKNLEASSQEEILVSDELITASEDFKPAEEIIVEDEETERLVQEKLKKENSEYKSFSESEEIKEKTEGGFFSDEEEPISLSTEELSKILEETEETPEVKTEPAIEISEEKIEEPQYKESEVIGEIEPELADVTPLEELGELESGEELKIEQPSELEKTVSFEEQPQELEEFITTEEKPVELKEEVLLGEEKLKAESEEVPESIESKEKKESFFEELEDESITLSDKELENILKSSEIEEPVEIKEEIPVESITTEEFEVKEEEFLKEKIEPEFEAIKEEKEYEELKEVEQKPEEISPVTTAPTSDIESLKNDLRKLLLYLDKILEKLPEDVIKEFAESDYYDLYNKIFTELGL